MIISIKPRNLFFSLTTTQNLKWLSTKPTPNHLIYQFFNRKTITPQDYEHTLVSALKQCTATSKTSITHGQQLHSLILKSGLNSNTFILNSIINMYAKCGFISQAKLLFDACSKIDSVSWNIILSGYVKVGNLEDARKMFNEMPDKGCVSYTTIIMGYAKKGLWSEAFEIFKGMMYDGVVPNEVTMASVMSACSRLDEKLVGSCGAVFHGLVVKLGVERMVVVSTNLLHLYCLCLRLGDARRLFGEMSERNNVSWNVMLNGYSKVGFVDLAKELFDRIPEKDVVSWGTMIDGYIRVERLNDGLMIYKEMVANGLGPNDVMIVDLVSACGRLHAVVEGEQIHGVVIKRGFDLYNFIQATIIYFYAACGIISHARLQFELGIRDHIASSNALIAGFIRNGMLLQASQLFNEMPRRDVFSWSSIISGYTQGDQPNVALELFGKMLASGIRPNECTMVSVLSSIAALGIVEEGRLAHKYIIDNNIRVNDNLSAALIDMYAKCGSISTALEVFYGYQEKVFTVSPWNAIICGLAMHGHAKMSLDIFSKLQRCHIKPNSITFIGVLTACCHAGYVEQGRSYFKSMQSVYNINPEMKHYGCMVDLLGRAGRLEEAEELIKSMPMKADAIIWGTLLAACRTYGNLDIAERAAENLSRVEPSHGGARVLLSNIYADAGRWEDVFVIRKEMQSQGAVRSPGCSGVV